MQLRGEHIALVTDDDDNFTGLVTDEDAIEKIFGQIYDEHDTPNRTDNNSNEISIKATINIKELNEAYGLHIPESRHYATLAGFLTYSLKSIPSPGAVIVIEGLTFTIDNANKRKITRVSITIHD